jgi:alpha-D-ribose 1-methylphosphonate 5-triphosphate synthase subunit PhnG
VTTAKPELGPGTEARKRRIEIFARANAKELQAAFDGLEGVPAATMVRGPETGLVMIRGRMGGTGSAFNLGEATVTRATVRLENGLIGHGQRLGGDKEAARLSALLDALSEMSAYSAEIEAFADQVAERFQGEDTKLSGETAATRVDFFTMVRGDD